MRNEKEIIQALTESQLTMNEMELWDGEPEMHTNKGWQEALSWVLKITKQKRYNYGTNKDKNTRLSR